MELLSPEQRQYAYNLGIMDKALDGARGKNTGAEISKENDGKVLQKDGKSDKINTKHNDPNIRNGGQHEKYDSQYSKILGRREISTSNRGENNIRKYSKNTRTLQGLLGISDAELRKGNFRAGQSEWLEGYHGELGFVDPGEIKRLRRFLQSFRRELSETKLKDLHYA